MGNTHPQADSQFTQIQYELKSHLNFKLKHKVNCYFKINPSTIVFNNNSVFFCACFDLLAWTCGCVLALFMMTVPTEQGVPWKSIWLQDEKSCAEGKPKLHRKITEQRVSQRDSRASPVKLPNGIWQNGPKRRHHCTSTKTPFFSRREDRD